MKSRVTAVITAAVLLMAAFTITGCYKVDLREAGDTTRESVALGAAEDAVVNLDMGAGDLMVEGGASDLMEGRFIFNDGRYEPDVDYVVRGDTGTLKVRQPSGHSIFGLDTYRNKWEIQLADDVPMELNVDIGAGESNLVLGDLMLTGMTVEAGAGDVTIDLTDSRYLTDLDVELGAGALVIDLSGDDWREDLDGSITAGAGDITVILPRDVGVRIDVEKGLGEVVVHGLTQEGSGVYVNKVYGESDVVIDLDVEAGLGQITFK